MSDTSDYRNIEEIWEDSVCLKDRFQSLKEFESYCSYGLNSYVWIDGLEPIALAIENLIREKPYG